MRPSSIICALVLLAAVPTAGIAADGDLDPTFGIQGKVVGTDGSVQTLAVQSDGRILAAGALVAPGDVNPQLTRYDSDGSLDGSFGTGGTVITPIPGDAYPSSVLVQSDGKIVVTGTTSANFDSDIFLVRYETDGTLDATFGVGGVVTVSGPEDAGTSAAALQSNDKIVVVGGSDGYVLGDFLVMRFDGAGALDPTFGSGGQVTTDLGQGDSALAIAVQNDDGLVVGGQSADAGAVLLRYDADGAPDATFGSGGVVTVGAPGSRVFGIVLQADGAIVAARNAAFTDRTLLRYDASGLPDASFGTGGTTSVALDSAYFLGAQPDGRLLVAGSLAHSNAVLRYDADGQFDPTLSSCGAALTVFEGDNFLDTYAFAVQPDGRFLIASFVLRNANSPDYEAHPALARFGTPGTTACTPAPTGKSRLGVKGPDIVKWKWTGPATAAEFGTPDLGTDETFCLVDPATGAPRGVATFPGTTAFCDTNTCWKARATGFAARRGGIVLGKMRMKLLTTATGTGRVTMKNKGGQLHRQYTLNYPYPLPVIARVKRGDGGACWEATFSLAVKNAFETGLVTFSD